MDLNDLHPPDDYSHRFFIWHEWIQANGPLTSDNVFEYFAASMFYDKQSNNQVLRMQTMHTGMPIVNEAEELKRFTGIEFALVHAQPPSLFIIHKRERTSPEETQPLAAYFIMNNRIYQSPDMYSVLQNRLLTSLYSLQSSLDILRKHRPDYTPRTGFVWPIMEPPTSEDGNKKSATDDASASAEPDLAPGLTASLEKEKELLSSGTSKKLQNNLLLLNAMRTTAAHTRQTFALQTRQVAAQDPASEIVLAATAARQSMTPAPPSIHAATPLVAATASGSHEAAPAKAPPGAGKKKKKRMSVPAPPAP